MNNVPTDRPTGVGARVESLVGGLDQLIDRESERYMYSHNRVGVFSVVCRTPRRRAGVRGQGGVCDFSER